MLKDLSIGKKFTFTFSVLIVITIIQGWIGLRKMDNISDISYVTHQANRVLEYYQEANGERKDYLINGNTPDGDEAIEKFHSYLDLMMVHMDSLKIKTLDKTTNDLTEEITTNIDLYNTSFIKMVEAATYDNTGRILTDQPLFKSKKEEYTRLKRIVFKQVQDLLSIEDAAFNSALNKSRTNMIMCMTLSLLLGLSIAFIMTRAILTPIKTLENAAQGVVSGDLESEIEIHQSDEIGHLADAFRDLQKGLLLKAEATRKIAEGNLDVEIPVNSDVDIVGISLVSMRQQIQNIINEINTLTEHIKSGELDNRGDSSKFDGSWQHLITGINELIDAFVIPFQVTSAYVKQISRGDIPEKINEAYSGDFNEIKDNINLMIEVLGNLSKETGSLVDNAQNGNLKKRGNTSEFGGIWQELLVGINDLLDSVIKPIEESISVLSEMSKGNLSLFVEGDYKGDHARIKDALNSTLNSLNELLNQISRSATEVMTGSKQVSDSSQSLSRGALTQAASIEETSSSVMEIGSQTKTNAEEAVKANTLTVEVSQAAKSGNVQMEQMLEAMKEINDSSDEISRIIKVIDEIAFQTNLLALNAAVEAARAGIHGKGFAVVAEEVRNLAQRSAQAAKETTTLIEGSVNRIEKGSRMAIDTAKSFEEIIAGIDSVNSIISQIASDSGIQSAAINEVSSALEQINEVTQSNSASAEQGASASEELSGQATYLQDAISQFRLKSDNGIGLLTDGQS